MPLNKEPRSSKSLEKKTAISAVGNDDESSSSPLKIQKSEDDIDVSQKSTAQKKKREKSIFFYARSLLRQIPIVKYFVPSDRTFKVNEFVPEREKYTVYKEFSFYLNQTNIGKNSNKFYVAQILIDVLSTSQYHVFFCWGRQGDKNPQNMFLKNKTLYQAQSEFKKKFYAKTGFSWGWFSTTTSKQVPGRYYPVDVRDEDEDDQDDGEEKDDVVNNNKDDDAGSNKLSKPQIIKGIKVLNSLEKLFEEAEKHNNQKPPQADIDRFSSSYFTLIPTNVGRQKIVAIQTKDEVEEKKAMLFMWLKMGFDFNEKDAITDCHDDDQQQGSSFFNAPQAPSAAFIYNLDEYNANELGKKDHPLNGVMDVPLSSSLFESLSAKRFFGFIPSSLVYAGVIASASSKGADLEKKQAGNPTEFMSQELYAAICLYSGNAIYSTINACLRSEDRSQIEPYYKYLRLIFEAARKLKPKATTLYRGIGADLSLAYQEGKVVTLYSITSCTSSEAVAKGFSACWGGASTFCTIKTKSAVEITPLSFYKSERESLLMPGTQLKVVKAEKIGKRFSVTLEEVGQLVDYSS